MGEGRGARDKHRAEAIEGGTGGDQIMMPWYKEWVKKRSRSNL